MDFVQMFMDFISEYGILAAIVFGLMWYSGKRSKEQFQIMQGMIDNQAQETKQQDRLITQNGLTISKVSRLEDLFAKWIETHTVENSKKNTIIETGIESIDRLDGSVNNMNSDIELVVAGLAAMRKDMQELIQTVNQATSELKATVGLKTSEYESRIELLENSVKKITQETPVVPAKLEAVPKSTEAKTEKEETNE